jgi:tRNA(fMet)-specific endonuclease VapC
MPFLLDTNICIAIIKRKPPTVLKRVLSCEAGELVISAISVAELRFGADKSQFKQKSHDALDQFLWALDVDDFDERAATAYGVIRADLERRGTPIGPLETLLAAQAVGHELVLVTDNEREFRRVKQLKKVENWLQA